MKLTFHGGAKSVTGSNYLLESGKTKILVDCGLFQGSAFAELNNFKPFPYDPKEIDAVFITHAHIDHIGRLPQLYKAGFRGKIYSTGPTKDFAELLLLDSEHILMQEAKRKKKQPIYEISDVVNVVGLWEKRTYHEKVAVGDFEVELFDAGHVLGSTSYLVRVEGKKIVFSGDLGNMPTPFIKPIEYFEDVDYALIEATYGDRTHENADIRKDILEDIIEETVKAKGVLMIPSFALERTQEMIFELNELVEHGRIPQIPVFIDSPLAIKLTAVYQKYSKDPRYFSPEAIALIESGDIIFNFPGLTMTLTPDESKRINDVSSPKIILAGAGMSNGGRILYHEERYLSGKNNTIVFVGYQAHGSLGRGILEGAKQVRIFGNEIAVNCKVRKISGYSAHADEPQLLEWLRPMRLNLKKLFIVQCEEDQAVPFAQKVKDELAIETEIPTVGESVII